MKKQSWKQRLLKKGFFGLASLALTLPVQLPAFADTLPSTSNAQTKPAHVIYIIADNVHMEDIKQMPHLMSFLQNGTVLDNDHTILDSHTQDGMLSDMTGQYPSKTGVPDQSFYANGSYSSFLYWTTPDNDGQAHVTTAPPWSVFNKNGFSVGAVAAPDMELEKTKEVTSAMMNNATGDTNLSDYLGVTIHNADGTAIQGAPNIPYIYNATSWADPTKTLGGFPGWGNGIEDANYPLEATYLMQTNGVPVTFTYLHDVHEVNGKQQAPGNYGTVLQQYDSALNTFFTKLNQAGINSSNTLFVFTTDEGDHYMPNGEYAGNVIPYLTTNNPIYTTDPNNLNVISDSGALFYLKDPSNLNKTLASLQAVPGWNYVADPAELKTLHVASNQAPTRTPSFILFSKPDIWYNTSGSATFSYNSNYLWNHGTISPDICTTWLGLVGPGIKSNTVSHEWLDHADTMPTIYQVMGFDLNQPQFDGVPAFDAIDPAYLPTGVAQNGAMIRQASELFKQLNAPLGQFGMSTLSIASQPYTTVANSVYRDVYTVAAQASTADATIANLSSTRDLLASTMQQDLLKSWSSNQYSNDWASLVNQAQIFLNSVTPVNYGVNSNSLPVWNNSTVTASVDAYNDVHLNWTAAQDAYSVSYRVFVNNNIVEDVYGTSCDLYGLAPNTSYTIAVQATDNYTTWTTNGPATTVTTNAGPQGHPFTLTEKEFSTNGGIKVTVNVAQTPGIQAPANKSVVFELMNGSTPISINAVQSNTQMSEDISSYFNVLGTGYSVKVFVVDSYDSSSTTNVGVNLATPLTIQQ